jgi:hypothetical protein
MSTAAPVVPHVAAANARQTRPRRTDRDGVSGAGVIATAVFDTEESPDGVNGRGLPSAGTTIQRVTACGLRAGVDGLPPKGQEARELLRTWALPYGKRKAAGAPVTLRQILLTGLEDACHFGKRLTRYQNGPAASRRSSPTGRQRRRTSSPEPTVSAPASGSSALRTRRPWTRAYRRSTGASRHHAEEASRLRRLHRRRPPRALPGQRPGSDHPAERSDAIQRMGQNPFPG